MCWSVVDTTNAGWGLDGLVLAREGGTGNISNARGFVRVRKSPSSDTDAAAEPTACLSVQTSEEGSGGIIGRLRLVTGLPRPTHRKILILRVLGPVADARQSAPLASGSTTSRMPVILEIQRVLLPPFDRVPAAVFSCNAVPPFGVM
jgi:hypothetical protein